MDAQKASHCPKALEQIAFKDSTTQDLKMLLDGLIVGYA